MKIKNYLTLAIRVFVKKKLYTSINIIGLVLGGVSFLILLMIAQYELSFDRYHENAAQIHRVGIKANLAGNALEIPYVGAPCAQVLVDELPEVEAATRLFGFQESMRFDINGVPVKEEKAIYADNNFFDIFSFKLIKGEKQLVLNEVNSVVLSQSAAKKYFGSKSPVGEILNMQLLNDRNIALKVTGVYEDFPDNTHFDFDLLISMETSPVSRNEFWLANDFYTYLLLKNDSDLTALKNKFPVLLKKYLGNDLKTFMNMSIDEFLNSENKINLFLQPLTSIHLHSKLENELGENSDIIYVYILLSIGILILVIACINFVNLTTAGFADRAKEIGIRKVVGSTKMQIVTQYMLNSMLITFASLVLSLIVVYFTLPLVNDLLNTPLSLNLFNLSFSVKLITGWLIVSFLAGSYPSFYLSIFKPTEVLKGKLKSGMKNGVLRNSLVIFQFAISTILIICTIMVYKQMKLIQSQDLGFDEANLVTVYNMDLMSPERSRSFRDALLNDPSIESATLSDFTPFETEKNYSGFIYKDETHRMRNLVVDNRYLETLSIEIIEGSNFKNENVFSEVLINEKAMKLLGWDNINGKTIRPVDSYQDYPVAGVIKDFHGESLVLPLEPMVLFNGNNASYLTIKTKPEGLHAAISQVRNSWNNTLDDTLFEYTLMDDKIAKAHKPIEDLNSILKIFTVLIICVAGLGLFSLSAYSAEQKKREVGIRKVLGAVEMDVIAMFFKNFLQLAILAILISIPVAWYVTNIWLQDFAIKVEFGVFPSVLAASILLLITLFTTTFHSLKLAQTNPITTIKND